MVLFTLLIPACALLISGTTQVVTISATPPDATIRLLDTFYTVRDGEVLIDSTQYVTRGSMSVRLRRGQPHRFAVECRGYKTAHITTGQSDNAWVWADLISPLSFLGPIADFSSGAGYNIVPESIPVVLDKGQGTVPDRIYPTAPSAKGLITTLQIIIIIGGLALLFAWPIAVAAVATV